MRFPTLNPGATSRDYVEEFRGYNHNLRITDGEFYDEENFTSDNYPVLTLRQKRNEYLYSGTGTHQTVAAISKDELYYVDNLTLYKKGELEDTELWDFSTYVDTTAHPATEMRHLVSMGAYLIILPDALYYNTVKPDDKGGIGYVNEYEMLTGSDITTIELCDEGGTVYTNITVAENEPTSPTNGHYWLQVSPGLDVEGDSSQRHYWQPPGALKKCSKVGNQPAEWMLIENVYLKITAPGISEGVKTGDWVMLSLLDRNMNVGYSDYEIFPDNYNVYNHIFNQGYQIYKAEYTGSSTDYIVIRGLIRVGNDGATRIAGGANNTFKLTASNMPVLDLVIESGNRLWGCRYGRNRNGDFVNEIYASKLGDFRNWFAYEHLEDDSYTASCGTDGAFTGAVSYLGYPLFFKENVLHKVYGNMPSNYQIQSIACPARGVLKGAAGSLAIVGERLYYKSRSGVCVYDGSLPVEISAQLGSLSYNATEGDDELWNGAVGGANGTKYYITMKSDTDGEWNLFVYDAVMNVWHREDNMRVYAYVRDKDTMYYVTDGPDGQKVLGYYGGEDNALDWYVVTGDLGLGSPDKKYVSRVTIRMSLAINAYAIISIQYDNRGEWKHVTTFYGSNLQSFSIPVRPRRCDHFRLKIEGKGFANLYSISKTIEQGSER